MELEKDPCVRLWLRRVPSMCKSGLGVLRRWVDEDLKGHPVFGGMSVSELVDWQATHYAGREGLMLRVSLQLWIDGLDLRFQSKQRYFSNVASLFLHNHAYFPPDPSFKFRSEKAPVVGCLVCGAFRKILLNCNPKYRSIFLMMGQGIMGENEFMYVNENLAGHVLRSVTENVGVFQLDLPGRKARRNKVGFATYLCSKSDFADAFRDYLKTVEHDVSKVLFLNDFGNPITAANILQCFHARAVETGVIKQITPACLVCGCKTSRFRMGSGKKVSPGLRKKVYYLCANGHKNWASSFPCNFSKNRYGVNPHEIRDLMRTRWQSSNAMSEVAEFMMGHTEKVDSNQYLSWMKYEKHVPKREYLKALPYLNVLSCEPNKVDKTEVQEEMNAQRREIAELRKKTRDMEVLYDILQDPEKLKKFKDFFS